MILSVFFFLLYIVAVVFIGWIASRKETEEGFMIADRNVMGLQLAATMSAGFFDGATLSIYIAFYDRGIWTRVNAIDTTTYGKGQRVQVCRGCG